MSSPSKTHGPIVKTGPTAGQVRSRNKNGRWRKTRSDAGIPRKPKMEKRSEAIASPSKTHGPLVRTGSTTNQDRSRHKSGSWHKPCSNAGIAR